ncbi:SDR family oxidoreductase [Sorangium sp. So ce388]|uniref:SDR family oxidoreductase n=1 Tax=Sorangium sp. So ce388 TaxID=3133309 RepID=UPI003F5B419E
MAAAPQGRNESRTKMGLIYLTRSWAIELAPAGIRVNCISPGLTDTPGRHRRAASGGGAGPRHQAWIERRRLRTAPASGSR